MPVIIPEGLPATKVLKEHGIFVMAQTRAQTQDIRSLKICILNLMPDKVTTEIQLLSKLSNGIIQIEITLLAIENPLSKNTQQSHLDSFYRYFTDIKNDYFDGLIITGAPIERFEFEDVSYWHELKKILDWSKTNVFSSLFICWGSQVALYHFYDIKKQEFPQKLFGVYPHRKEDENTKLLIGMDDVFYVPHSRNTQSDQSAIRDHPNLNVIASSVQAGIHLIASKDQRQLFMAGHPEYDADTLLKEYLRDIDKDNVLIPEHYFIDNDPNKKIQTQWKSHASMFYQNWLNYYVYQETEYDHVFKNISQVI